MSRKPVMPSPRQVIYHRIAEAGSLSKAELMEQFSLPSSTMTRLLEELVSERFIQATGLGPSSGGRRPILYELYAGYGYFFGLEISRFHSALGFFDSRMNPMSFTRWHMDESMTPEMLINHVEDAMKAILHDHHIDSSQVRGVGVGAVGPLDREQGIILRPQYFPAQGWTDVPICQLIKEKTGFEAFLENGANAALVGEHWAMRNTNPQHMLYVHAGVSLRSAMLSNGQIVHGSVDMEGAIGQMIIQTDGPRLQEKGNFGALEAFVSVQALEKLAQSHAKMGRSPLADAYSVRPEQIRYDLLLQALRQDHPYAVELFQQAASHLGIGLANLINTLHPEIIILGGALIYSHERFYQTAIEVARKNTYYYPEYQPVFSKGQLREEAVATGAALLVWRGMTVH